MSETAKAELEDTRDRMFNENQAKLAPELRCVMGAKWCEEDDEGYTCTCAVGHVGDHAAHGRLGIIVHRWPRSVNNV